MLIDSNKLIEAIKEHANNCAEGEGVIDQAYKLAHYHIIELVNLLALRAEAESKADSAGDLISREALKKKAETITLWNGDVRRFVSYETIDNAPTVDTNEPTLNESIAFHNGYELGKSERPQGDNKEALFVLNHLFYDCDNMTHKEYDILREAIMKGGAE